MIKIDSLEVMNVTNSFRGMRNPLDSWDDASEVSDKELALTLIRAGSDHSKFMRQILVSIDITGPLYWWKEMDQYRVGATTNSCSTMHTIHKTPITAELFSVELLDEYSLKAFRKYCCYLEELRLEYITDGDKKIWDQLIQMLPSSFNQMRTWTGNYQILRNIYHNRKNHKLQEWRDFCKEIEGMAFGYLITTK